MAEGERWKNRRENAFTLKKVIPESFRKVLMGYINLPIAAKHIIPKCGLKKKKDKHFCRSKVC